MCVRMCSRRLMCFLCNCLDKHVHSAKQFSNMRQTPLDQSATRAIHCHVTSRRFTCSSASGKASMHVLPTCTTAISPLQVCMPDNQHSQLAHPTCASVLLMKALIPKSVILGSPLRLISMFAGLMSRCTCGQMIQACRGINCS